MKETSMNTEFIMTGKNLYVVILVIPDCKNIRIFCVKQD